MQTGYPRFFIHKSIQKLAQAIATTDDELAMLFPTHGCAVRCAEFMFSQVSDLKPSDVRILDYVPHQEKTASHAGKVLPKLSVVLFPKARWPIAKLFWQHSGEGISSRRAEFCQRALDEGSMVEKSTLPSLPRMHKGPRRYQRNVSIDQTAPNGGSDPALFVEERFGRNLDIRFAAQAKVAIRRRIAGSLTADEELPKSLEGPVSSSRSHNVPGFSVDDVYLYSCGMNAIYQAHRTMMLARGASKSIMYGFPYVDTLKILEKFGPGCTFYGYGSSEDLDDLEKRLESGERYLALFCEFPGNPLLRTPDLQRIRALADKYDFAVIVDETIGNFLNIHVLPYADVVVSSLTKIFSGDSNVMGGSMVLNPKSQYYSLLKERLAVEYEDNHFEEDSMFLERNSRDFVSRIQRVNTNAEAICEVLLAHPKVKQVNYPKHSSSRKNYDACKLPNGGYGGLLSATFYSLDDAAVFYDHLNSAKGPSLGTNFTLRCVKL